MNTISLKNTNPNFKTSLLKSDLMWFESFLLNYVHYCYRFVCNKQVRLDMPRKPCLWTRRLDLELVEFIRAREYVWKSFGNTNHHILQKYRAYAEFAAKLGHGFTARSVRDRWVNIRSTFNHNVRHINKSKETATSSSDIYVPCWPLWKPLQFLRDTDKKENGYQGYPLPEELKELSNDLQLKEEDPSDFDELGLTIRQGNQRTSRPRRRTKIASNVHKNRKCKRVIDDLVKAMKPLVQMTNETGRSQNSQSYWFFGKHVTERLNCMREDDVECAIRDIWAVLGLQSTLENV